MNKREELKAYILALTDEQAKKAAALLPKLISASAEQDQPSRPAENPQNQ